MRVRRRAIQALLAVLLIVGMSGGVEAPANAASVSCGWPRCVLYLNRGETTQYAYWGVISSPNMGAFSSVLYVFAMANRWFAIQYANRGLCVGFNLSLAPWESQGLFGYRC